MTTIKYEVRYRYYQYNTGLADNGIYTEAERCKTLQEAQVIYDKLLKLINQPNPKTKIADELIGHLNSGYVDKVIGIYKITEEMILREKLRS